MGDMLSQAEIDALLNGMDKGEESNDDGLSLQEIDALGEIGNISMGTAATTLFTLLGHKVTITTPDVKLTTWDDMADEYPLPYVGVKIEYIHGLEGSNFLLLKEDDVKIITNLMMGGEGKSTDEDLSDLHLSAISEVMNQMVGSSSTSLSSMLNKKINISPPKAFLMKFKKDEGYENFQGTHKVVRIAFRMLIGDIIDSNIMQLIPVQFARELVNSLINSDGKTDSKNNSQAAGSNTFVNEFPDIDDFALEIDQYGEKAGNEEYAGKGKSVSSRRPVNVQPAQFKDFNEGMVRAEKRNINLIMDVPLQVTVELGRTQKLIKDILEFGSGSIIELDKLAGEPVDILVNNKHIATGEVVVIDESFGVRVTDIVDPSKRL